MVRVALAIIIVAHGIGHVLFLIPLLGVADWGQSTQSWLLGGDTPAKLVGSLLWVVAIIGFTAAGIGLLRQQEWWRRTAIASSVVSFIGLILFLGNPITSSAFFAAAFDVIIPIALLVAHWPSTKLIGA